MQCPNCGQETKGIKLNGKLFCTFCGELLKDPTELLEEAYQHQPTEPAKATSSPIQTPPAPPESLSAPLETPPIPKIIPATEEAVLGVDNTELPAEENLLEAEEEVLDILAKKKINNTPLKNKAITKHHRKRADHPTYGIIPGEPDPIKQPELESPHDMEVEREGLDATIPEEPPLETALQLEPIADSEPTPAAPAPSESAKAPVPFVAPSSAMTTTEEEPANILPETDIPPIDKPETPAPPSYPLIPKEQREQIQQKAKHHRDIFSSFLKETGRAVASKKKSGKKAKPRKKHILGWSIFIVCLIAVTAFISLNFYVRNVATNETKIKKEIERSVNFSYVKPERAPDGYRLSYFSESGSNYIGYYYSFGGNQERFVSMKAEPTTIKQDEIQDKIITNQNTGFKVYNEGGLEFWQTENHRVYVIKDGILYTFEQSGELSDSYFLKYAQEMLL